MLRGYRKLSILSTACMREAERVANCTRAMRHIVHMSVGVFWCIRCVRRSRFIIRNLSRSIAGAHGMPYGTVPAHLERVQPVALPQVNLTIGVVTPAHMHEWGRVFIYDKTNGTLSMRPQWFRTLFGKRCGLDFTIASHEFAANSGSALAESDLGIYDENFLIVECTWFATSSHQCHTVNWRLVPMPMNTEAGWGQLTRTKLTFTIVPERSLNLKLGCQLPQHVSWAVPIARGKKIHPILCLQHLKLDGSAVHNNRFCFWKVCKFFWVYFDRAYMILIIRITYIQGDITAKTNSFLFFGRNIGLVTTKII